jgi:hypothetical protein
MLWKHWEEHHIPGRIFMRTLFPVRTRHFATSWLDFKRGHLDMAAIPIIIRFSGHLVTTLHMLGLQASIQIYMNLSVAMKQNSEKKQPQHLLPRSMEHFFNTG